MKVKVFLLSCCTFLFSSCATIITGSRATVVIDGSQKIFRHHEIGTNVGFLSCVGRNRMDKTGAFLEHQLGCEVGDQCNYFGPVSLGLHYYYHLDSRWGVGLAYQYAYGYKPYDKMSEQQPVGWCDVLVRSHSLMAAVKRQWLECGSLSFYSKVALGFQHRHVYCSFRDAMQQARTPDDKRWLLAYQLSPACMEVGNRVRFFMEWGYGQEGVFTIGLNTRI